MTPAPERPDTGHGRLANRPEWAVGDWHCECGWWGSHGWEGFANHLLHDALAAAAPAPDAGLREALTVERLAEAIILGYYEGQAKPWQQNLGNGFEWYGSALEMAQAILNGLSRQAEKETA